MCMYVSGLRRSRRALLSWMSTSGSLTIKTHVLGHAHHSQEQSTSYCHWPWPYPPPPLFFSSGEGRSQPGLCPSVLCPFPPLTPQVLPPACSMSPLPRLPRSCADTDHFCLSLNLTAPVEHTKACRCHLQNR